jgi:hypothetical protein
MFRAGRFHTALPGREVRHHRVEVCVRITSPQEIQNMLAKRVGFSHDLEKHNSSANFNTRRRLVSYCLEAVFSPAAIHRLPLPA